MACSGTALLYYFKRDNVARAIEKDRGDRCGRNGKDILEKCGKEIKIQKG
jgi:hypothetical protein